MSWRTIIISKPAKLSLYQQQLLLEQQEKITIPIEDIAIILIEAKEVVITAPLLSKLAQNGTSLITCDNQFLPCGQWLSLCQHHRHLKIINKQINMSQPFKNQLRKIIIQAKINNQAWVLHESGHDKAAELLYNMTLSVKSADKTNMESQAASLYFKVLFNDGFTRRNTHYLNAYLNYGYMVLRSTVARALVKYGFLPTLGIFHHSELNAFNLADDLLEPYRTIVDLWVWTEHCNNNLAQDLSSSYKHQLVALLNYMLKIKQKKHTVLSGIDKTASSLQSSLLNSNTALLQLPSMLKLQQYQYE